MKVMCVKIGYWTLRGIVDAPEYGDVVTAVDRFVNNETEVYLLLEFPYPGGYATEHFIPLSNIDETEMIRESIKETI